MPDRPKQIKKIKRIIEKRPARTITRLTNTNTNGLFCIADSDLNIEFTDEQIAEFERRVEEMESGKVKTYTEEEFEAIIRKADGIPKSKLRKRRYI